MQLLESKTKDLPTFEARKLKKHFAEATAPQIEKEFDKACKKVLEDTKKDAEEAESTLESEVQKIVDSEDIEENDMLRNRSHNNHISDPAAAKFNEDEEKDFETTESVKFNEDGDVELEDEDVIDESTMNRWCQQSIERF